ncbi:hypothetical protein [Mumia zhuanghuii]|uniref:Uncharacterized protein n=1 Tax=Mumia zhuanghuii TaxID=2585211 RepID=A0A5C4LTR2_9ACTN|nr:hypothetical protein [Mumia zhuanghuii]TNC21760.1 hypothetical protein FHE65_36255 [Mumia zhuanghuii]
MPTAQPQHRVSVRHQLVQELFWQLRPELRSAQPFGFRSCQPGRTFAEGLVPQRWKELLSLPQPTQQPPWRTLKCLRLA